MVTLQMLALMVRLRGVRSCSLPVTQVALVTARAIVQRGLARFSPEVGGEVVTLTAAGRWHVDTACNIAPTRWAGEG